MATQKQTKANQANAQKSTGPTSDEGKAASAQNATTHGLTKNSPCFNSRFPTVAPAEHHEFMTLAAELMTDTKPQGALEAEVYANLLWASWQLRRARRLEAQCLDQLPPPDQPLDPDLEHRLSLYTRYATRWERSQYRALAELRRLQSTRLATQTAPLEVQEHVEDTPTAASSVIEKLASFGRTLSEGHDLMELYDKMLEKRENHIYPIIRKDPQPQPQQPPKAA